MKRINILISGGLARTSGNGRYGLRLGAGASSASLIVSILGAFVIMIGIGILVCFFKENKRYLIKLMKYIGVR